MSTSTFSNARIVGYIDVPAAVMSLVVKLRFPFKVIHKDWHLLEATIICVLFLKYSVHSSEHYQHSVHCCKASDTDLSRNQLDELFCLILSFSHMFNK